MSWLPSRSAASTTLAWSDARCAYDIPGHAPRARGRLRYQCFETRNRAAVGAPAPALSLGPGARATLEEFVRAYEVDKRGFGMWTDLLCVNLATMRR